MSTRTEQLNALAKLAGDGSTETLHALWAEIEKLSAWLCSRTFNKLGPSIVTAAGVELDDLIQCGYFAMLSALDTFDPENGGSFAHWFKLHLLTEISVVTGSRTARQRSDPLRLASTTRLETPVGGSDDGEAGEFGDLIPDEASEVPFLAVEEDVFNRQLHDQLDKAMTVLSDRERTVLEEYYYHDQTYKQIAAALNVSVECVRRLRNKSLYRLRTGKAARSLHLFIDDRTDFYRRGADPVAANVIWREELGARFGNVANPTPLPHKHKNIKHLRPQGTLKK